MPLRYVPKPSTNHVLVLILPVAIARHRDQSSFHLPKGVSGNLSVLHSLESPWLSVIGLDEHPAVSR